MAVRPETVGAVGREYRTIRSYCYSEDSASVINVPGEAERHTIITVGPQAG